MALLNQPDAAKSYRIGKQILNESDLKVQVEYNGEVFTLKLANPLERSAIEAEIARRLGGLPRESFSADHVVMIEATTYVANCIVKEESPDWFNAWTCLDEKLIAELYAGYLRFRDRFRERIAANGFLPSGGGAKT